MLNISKNNIPKIAESDKFYAMKLLNTLQTGRIVAYCLVGIFVICLFVMILPWQQNIYANGEVTALTPQDRPQTIETAIAGRIEHWHIREGQFVNKGEIIVDISEIKDKFFDPEQLTRIREQLQAKSNGLEATQVKINALNNQIAALQNALKYSLQKANNKIRQSTLKVKSDSADYQAEKLNYDIAKKQFLRQEILYKQGLKSLTELEQRKQKFQESQAKLIAVENKYLTTRNDLMNVKIELNSIQAEYTDKISKATSDKSSAVSYFSDATSEFSKLKNEQANQEIRRKQYNIRAPQDGYIIKTLKEGVGETVKEGEAICTIMPDEPAMAVAMYVKPMDVSLLSKGRRVRIEFDGWPALQFSGWPSVSVGTFGGVIDVIDFVDSKEGKYRILVRPDHNDDPWPKQIRMGSGVKGWAMLDEVPIWYELWRQLNGFPPRVQLVDPSKTDKYYEKGTKY